jgi:putative phosphoribosyl transferase
MNMHFEDRQDAGKRLAAALPQFRERPDTVVLGLARGGIPVASALATGLYLPYGALLVRKLGIPGHDETAYGALALAPEQSGDRAGEPTPEQAKQAGEQAASAGPRIVRIINKPLVAAILEHGVRQEWLDQVEDRERQELLRRAETYPELRHALKGKTVILADDGLATGATMRAAVEAVRGSGASTVVVAVPVASVDAQASLERVSDSVLSLHLPGKFRAVGAFYRRFEQLTDEDAIRLLQQA